jgi:hypothetical protein
MHEVSILRLNLLRSFYLLWAVGLGTLVWPKILFHTGDWQLLSGVARCLLAAMSVVALLGLRYPLKMLPMIFFEILWKCLWLVVVALPLWLAHEIDPVTAESVKACGMVIIVPFFMPWRYIIDTYIKAPGNPWTKRGSLSTVTA